MVKVSINVKKAPVTYKFDIDHNPYEVSVYSPNKSNGKIILFPIFHYNGDNQFLDLLNPIIEKGYKVFTFNLLSKGDRALFLNYYAKAFEFLINECIKHNYIKKEELIVMGFGAGATIASYLEKTKIKRISKFILLSPLNHYKDDYFIARDIKTFSIPTYIFYGQNDSVNNIDSRYSIFENGHTNKKVFFSSYPNVGYFLYYEAALSISLEDEYRYKGIDLVTGSDYRIKEIPMVSEAKYNIRFFEHLFLVLEDKPFKKRVALLTDVFPLFINGVITVVNLLKEELDKMGYETYIIALWDKKVPLEKLPADYIPVSGRSASLIKGHRELHLLRSFVFQKNAKMLSMFGFDYLHLHTEYSIGQIALFLAKFTGIKMVYSYHTLWKMYYEKKFGKFAGDFTYNTARDLLFSRIYKECPVVIVPSQKTYEILDADSGVKDIRVIPSSIAFDRFTITKDDQKIIKSLKEQYHLEKKKVIGYIGRVSSEKNIAETLEYVANVKNEIPNIAFVIVGDGDAVKPLKKLTKKLKLEDDVIFVGEVENAKLKYYYGMLDVFVTASNFETQGLTYFEAATCGTPILAKEDKALEGIFIDGENAYIYKDFYQWVERIEKALFTNNKKIIDKAKDTMKQFAPDKWAKKISDIYIEINK